MKQSPYDAAMAAAMAADPQVRSLASELFDRSAKYRYTYNFSWLGRPIIQYPEDVLAMQEIIWHVRPRLIVETGVAHGGSAIFFASMLELIGGDGLVAAIELQLRPENRAEIERSPLAKRIKILDGSSTDPDIVRAVGHLAENRDPVIVVLDSDHTHAHVLRELEAYRELVGKGSYIVVFDTVIELMPPDAFPDRPWGRGNNPLTAVREFLASDHRFEVDKDLESKLLLSTAPGGYLRRRED